MVVKSFPMHDVNAIGRKLDGNVGSCSAAGFPMSLTVALFQLYSWDCCLDPTHVEDVIYITSIKIIS